MSRVAVYWIIGLAVVVLLANVGVAVYVSSLRDDVNAAAKAADDTADGLKQTAKSQNLGCKRANTQRDATRFLLEARVHDSDLIANSSTNAEIAAYFKGQSKDAQMKLDALLKSAALTIPNKDDPFLINCDLSYPIP